MRCSRRVVVGIAGLVLLVSLAACSSSSGGEYVHIDVGATETALARPTATLTITPGPSPTPTATPLPFVIPTFDPALDPDQVIMRVGNIDITLAEYQKQVRFERFHQIYGIVGLVERQGEQILDLTRSENAFVASTFHHGGTHYEHVRKIFPHVVTSRSLHTHVILEQNPNKQLLRIFSLTVREIAPIQGERGLFNRDYVPDTRHMNLYSVRPLFVDSINL